MDAPIKTKTTQAQQSEMASKAKATAGPLGIPVPKTDSSVNQSTNIEEVFFLENKLLTYLHCFQ